MSEKENLTDRLLDRIKKQTIINGIKTVFKKFPQARVILPFLKDTLGTATKEIDSYLGDADHIIIIGRKQGISNLVIINGKKKFTLSTGLNITQDKTDPAIVDIQPFNKYLKEIEESGIFDLITEEDTKKFEEMKAGGFKEVSDIFQPDNQQKQIDAPAEEKTTELGDEEAIPAPDNSNQPQ